MQPLRYSLPSCFSPWRKMSFLSSGVMAERASYSLLTRAKSAAKPFFCLSTKSFQSVSLNSCRMMPPTSFRLSPCAFQSMLSFVLKKAGSGYFFFFSNFGREMPASFSFFSSTFGSSTLGSSTFGRFTLGSLISGILTSGMRIGGRSFARSSVLPIAFIMSAIYLFPPFWMRLISRDSTKAWKRVRSCPEALAL